MEWPDVVNALVGLAVGVGTGLFFERRANRSTRQHNAELEAELSALRTSMYSIGAPHPTMHGVAPAVTSLADAVASRARSTLDARGRVTKASLTAHFFGLGHRADDIETAIHQLCEAGTARDDGKWLEFR
jgi:hypothetical protein